MKNRQDLRGSAADVAPGVIVEIMDERDPLAGAALQLIASSFPPQERHSMFALREEIEEKRLGLLTHYNYHLIAMVSPAGRPLSVVAGRYLVGVNAGFVTYLAVEPEFRGQRFGHYVRSALVEAFRADARVSGEEDLAWVIGEVQVDSPWLHALIRHGRAIPFHLAYYHPGLTPGVSPERYVLYRQPVLDRRPVLSAAEVRQILYAIWRRSYRVGHPLRHEAFQVMLAELEGREVVGPHPEVMELALGRPAR